MSEHVQEVSDASFDSEVVKSVGTPVPRSYRARG